MRCDAVLPKLDALRTLEVPEGDATDVRRHIGTCDSCRDFASELVVIARDLAALDRTPPAAIREALLDSYAKIADGRDTIWVAFTLEAVRLLHRGSFDTFASLHAKRFGALLRERELPEALRVQVLDALEGRGVRKPRVEFRTGKSPLEREVLETLTKIPRGEVRTYEWVARQVGRPRAVRAVGNVCASNLVPILVPCHRVVPTTGGLGRYIFGSATKRELLRREGVDVELLESLAKKHVRLMGSRTTNIVCFPTCRDAKRIREENRVLFTAPAKATAAGFRPCMHCQPFAA